MRRSGGGFFDGEAADRGAEPVIVLRRIMSGGRERFSMLNRIAYHDPAYREPHVIPTDPATFTSDLTSVPAVFAWLVPRSGAHLPAALLHDALVAGPQEYRGPVVTRLEADRIFRDSMAALGTSVARRWLMWAAVVMATIWVGGVSPARWYRGVLVGTLGVTALVGLISTLDVADVVAWLPWLGDRPWHHELGLGLVVAVALPAALALWWGRLWPVGLIAGLALALLLHVTLALVVLTALFRLIESALELLDRRLSRR